MNRRNAIMGVAAGLVLGVSPALVGEQKPFGWIMKGILRDCKLPMYHFYVENENSVLTAKEAAESLGKMDHYSSYEVFPVYK